MGDLIVMTRETRRTPPVTTGASAEILFFTGVRYYRMPDVVPAVPADLVAPIRRRSDKAKKTVLPRRLKRQG